MSENRSNSALFKRADQLKRWEESDTFQEPCYLKRKKSRISFPDACVFLAACSAGDKDEVRILLEKGVDINISNIDGLTALSQACIDDNLEMVEFLVEMGADINRSDNEGWTPLHATVSCGFLSIARFLLDNGADLTAVNFDGELPIDICDTDEMVQLLQTEVNNRGIDCDACRSEEEASLLADARRWLAEGRITEVPHPKTGAISVHVAAAKGYVQALSLLLKAGVDMNAQDLDGWTALHAAAYWGERDSCRVLCDNLCNMELTNFQGQTARDVADLSVVSLLETLKKKQLTLVKQRPELSHVINRRPVKTSPPSVGPSNNDVITPVSTDSSGSPSKQSNAQRSTPTDTPPSSVTTTSSSTPAVAMPTVVTSTAAVTTTTSATEAPSITAPNTAVSAKTTTTAKTTTRQSPEATTDKPGDVTPPPASIESKVRALPAEQSASATVVLSSGVPPPPSGSTSPTTQRRSVLPPSRDDESETRRRAHAKRVRETRRSTQGVTLEELKSAEQYVKNQLQQQQQKMGSSTTTSTGTAATTSPDTQTVSTATTTVITSSSPSIAHSLPPSTSSSTVSRDPSHTTSVTSGSGTAGLLDRRPSWRLRLDQNNKSKFCLEEVHSPSPPSSSAVSTSGSGDSTLSASSSSPHQHSRLTQRSASLTLPVTSPQSSVVDADTPTVTLSLPRRASAGGASPLPPGAGGSGPTAVSADDARESRVARREGGSEERAVAKTDGKEISGRSALTQNHVGSNQRQETDEDKENESRNQQVASNVAIQRRRKAKRRSTGVVNFLIEEIEKDKEDSAREVSSSAGSESSSKTLNRSDEAISGRVESKSANTSAATSDLNGDVDYKKLYEEAMLENDRLRVQLTSVEEEFREAKRHAEKSVQLANSRVAAVESEQRENRALERRLAEMEEDLKVMEELRTDNRRLLDENGALIRVISKLSK